MGEIAEMMQDGTLCGGRIMEASAQVKEHGLLFAEEMVLATIDGRKMMTRLPITKRNSETSGRWEWLDLEAARTDKLWGTTPGLQPPISKAPPEFAPESVHRIYPRYAAGDRIWIRETWAHVCELGSTPAGASHDPWVVYRADGDLPEGTDPDGKPWRWRSPMHMPRWAARIVREIVSVRAERVQDISDDDCDAEGLFNKGGIHLRHCGNQVFHPDHTCRCGDNSAQEEFAALWDSIYAGRGFSFDSNCWAWVIEYKPS